MISVRFFLNALLGTALLGLALSYIPSKSPWRDAPVPLFWIVIAYSLSTLGMPMHTKQFLDLYIVAVFVWAAWLIGRQIIRGRRQRALEREKRDEP